MKETCQSISRSRRILSNSITVMTNYEDKKSQPYFLYAMLPGHVTRTKYIIIKAILSLRRALAFP